MAVIKPLKGKYYGTVVELNNGESFDIWLSPNPDNYKASEREIAQGWERCDGFDHVETDDTFKVAQICADALTEAGY